jgi:hypothetical protein
MKKSIAIIQRVYKRSQKHRCNDFVLDNIIRRAIWNWDLIYDLENNVIFLLI